MQLQQQLQELQHILEGFEMFQLQRGGSGFCFSDFIGEEFDGQSQQSMLEQCSLGDLSELLQQFESEGQLHFLFDDGWFHLTFEEGILDSDFLSSLDWI